MSEKEVAGKIAARAASGGVLAKLLLFSISLGTIPLTTYYASLKYVYDGNSTYAAITAVVAANAVLIAYIITSLLEDRKENSASTEAESKKNR